MAYATTNVDPQQQYAFVPFSARLVHPYERLEPPSPGPDIAINASAYVWVEARFIQCMPCTGELPAVSVSFIKEDIHLRYVLAFLQGTPTHLADALRIYMDRIKYHLATAAISSSPPKSPTTPRRSLEENTQEQLYDINDSHPFVPKMEDSEQREQQLVETNETNHHVPVKPVQQQFHVLEESIAVCDEKKGPYQPQSPVRKRMNYRSQSPMKTTANFNILINRETYLLLSSYNNAPFGMLTWLTRASFLVEEEESNIPTVYTADRRRVRISGGRREVHLGAKVLKEVMIFIGNRFTHWFKPCENDKMANGKRNEVDEPNIDSERITSWSQGIEGNVSTNSEPNSSTNSSSSPGKSDDTNHSGEVIEPTSSESSPDKCIIRWSERSEKKTTSVDCGNKTGEIGNIQNKNEEDIIQGENKQEKRIIPTLQVIVVDEAETGKIIGYKGENIRKIEQESGAFVQMTKINICESDRRVRAIFFVGALSAVTFARKTIMNSVRFCMSYSAPEEKE